MDDAANDVHDRCINASAVHHDGAYDDNDADDDDGDCSCTGGDDADGDGSYYGDHDANAVGDDADYRGEMGNRGEADGRDADGGDCADHSSDAVEHWNKLVGAAILMLMINWVDTDAELP